MKFAYQNKLPRLSLYSAQRVKLFSDKIIPNSTPTSAILLLQIGLYFMLSQITSYIFRTKRSSKSS